MILSTQTKQQLIDLLVKHEGEILHVYKCPAGKDTIGVGRNLEDKGLSKYECDVLELGTYDKKEVIDLLKNRGITKCESRLFLSIDIEEFSSELYKVLPWIESAPHTVQLALIDMAFNMGIKGLLKFKKTLYFIKAGQYKEASVEMLNSRWARQVGNRAIELSEMIATS